jgi:hypothetical protein
MLNYTYPHVAVDDAMESGCLYHYNTPHYLQTTEYNILPYEGFSPHLYGYQCGMDIHTFLQQHTSLHVLAP